MGCRAAIRQGRDVRTGQEVHLPADRRSQRLGLPRSCVEGRRGRRARCPARAIGGSAIGTCSVCICCTHCCRAAGRQRETIAAGCRYGHVLGACGEKLRTATVSSCAARRRAFRGAGRGPTRSAAAGACVSCKEEGGAGAGRPCTRINRAGARAGRRTASGDRAGPGEHRPDGTGHDSGKPSAADASRRGARTGKGRKKLRADVTVTRRRRRRHASGDSRSRPRFATIRSECAGCCRPGAGARDSRSCNACVQCGRRRQR